MKARLAIVLGVGSLALAAAPAALADPVPIAPSAAEHFTARVGQLTFQAQSALSPAPTRMDFFVSRDQEVDSQVLANPIDTPHAGPVGAPAVYTTNPDSDANWPNKPGTYYWQAVYHNCAVGDPNCYGPIRSLILDPLAPPTQSSPANRATIRYGRGRTFSIADEPSYSHDGTHLSIEFATSRDLASDGTFAHPLFAARPTADGGGAYHYRFTRPFTKDPGTYYWIVERFDCAAEPGDCYVTNDMIRSFRVRRPGLPKTHLTHHPGRRTHKHRVRFAFTSNVRGASFQCFYTHGWTDCRSPQKFRHLQRGRYRFKVRAVAGGKRDPTPAKFLFKVVRGHHRH
jgi:hypothetical protein